MAAGLPELIDPLSSAASAHRLQGRISVSAMPRLMDALHSERGEGSVDIDLQCGVDDQGIRFIRGPIDAVVTVPCQRCLQDMELPLHTEMALGVVTSPAQADYLPEPYEALVVNSRTVALAKIVEDELLLVAPIVAMHDDPACRSDAEAEDGTKDMPREAKKNPFAVLERLKKH